MAQTSFWIAAEDGTELHVRSSEPDTRKYTALLIHGFAESGYVWHETCGSLASLCRTVTVDLRGHGESRNSISGRYDEATYVADVASVIAALHLEHIVLIGHSLGGRIALRLAAVHGEAIAAAVIVDTCPSPSARGKVQAAEYFRRCLRTYRSIEEYTRWLVDNRPLLPPERARTLAEKALRPCAHGFEPKLDPALIHSPQADPYADEPLDWNEQLRSVRCPTLLVRGAMSAFVTAELALDMVRQLPRGRLATVPRAGHSVMSDNEGAFLSLVRNFLATLPAAP